MFGAMNEILVITLNSVTKKINYDVKQYSHSEKTLCEMHNPISRTIDETIRIRSPHPH